jgi:hypothetical protein
MPTQSPPNHLSDVQVDRMVSAVEELAKTNMPAKLVHAALSKLDSREGKRRVLVTSFAQVYELMLVLQMGINSDVPAEDFKRNLEEIKRQNHAGLN